ncbi:MAG: hypothetical protein ACR2QC_04405 [Gammaproteobacteria bacterium]
MKFWFMFDNHTFRECPSVENAVTAAQRDPYGSLFVRDDLDRTIVGREAHGRGHEEIERFIADIRAVYGTGTERIAQLEHILAAILDADERGQGQPFAEAMDAAHKALGRDTP